MTDEDEEDKEGNEEGSQTVNNNNNNTNNNNAENNEKEHQREKSFSQPENDQSITKRISLTPQWVAKTYIYYLQLQLVVILEIYWTTKNLHSVNPG